MGAKHLRGGLILIFAISLAGCSVGGLKRLAPPGILKYQDLAKDQPIDPAIAARIEEISKRDGNGFPVLAEKSFKTPEGLTAKERRDFETDLLITRETAASAIETERTLAGDERTISIEDEKNAAQQAIAQDREVISEVRRAPTEPSE